MDAAEQIVALGYARTALSQIPRRSRRAGAIAGWLARFQDALGLAPRAARLREDRQDDLFGGAGGSAPDATEWRAILKRVEARAGRGPRRRQSQVGTFRVEARAGRGRRQRSAIALRLEGVARAVGLDEAETALLGLAARY
ncbi:MAG: hypothetical protein SNJ73_08745, partial [Acetobacteraceae bacterium]